MEVRIMSALEQIKIVEEEMDNEEGLSTILGMLIGIGYWGFVYYAFSGNTPVLFLIAWVSLLVLLPFSCCFGGIAKEIPAGKHKVFKSIVFGYLFTYLGGWVLAILSMLVW